jgi:uncharacterized protein (TIRG00374 family)
LSTPEQGALRKARAVVGVRWLGTLGLGAFLLSRNDLGPASAIVSDAAPRWIVLAVVLYFADRCAASAKWRLLVSVEGRGIPFWTALSIYLQSSFLGAALPATVGTDLVRARMAQPYAGNFTNSLSAVIVERLAGVIALVVSAAIGLAIFAPISSLHLVATPALWVAAGTASLIAAAWMISKFRHSGTVAPSTLLVGRVRRFANRLEGSLVAYRGHRKLVAIALAIAFGQQYLFTLINWLLAVALGIDVRLSTMLWVWPIVMMAIRLPISVLGFGVREVLLLEFIGRAGASEAGAVALGLASGLLDIVFIMLGGCLMLFLPTARLSKQAVLFNPAGSSINPRYETADESPEDGSIP